MIGRFQKRSRGRRALGLLALLSVGLAGAVWLWQRAHAPLPPLEVGLWYWDQPFHVTPAEAAQLEAMGIQRLFVRAGTFRKEGQGVRLTMPQTWETGAGSMEVHLVFNFDYSIVRDYANLSNAAIAAALGQALPRERARAESAGIQVRGFQLDFDCPTRRLPRYADLLRDLRARLKPQRLPLSITALPTWFAADAVQTVMDAVDFTVPQYYEAAIPRTFDRFATISHLSMLERGLRLAGQRGEPFYAGLPAYGHALVYDEQGRLVGLFRDMGVREAAHTPAFRLTQAFPADARGRPATRDSYIGEDIYDFVATVPANDGRGKGYHLVYDLPTPALVAQHLALVRAQRPRNCRGVILFRYPEPEATMALPLPSLAAILRGQSAAPQLQVKVRTSAAPWELIETGRQATQTPVDLTVSVTNVGAANTFLASDAVTLTLYLDRPGLEDVDVRSFDTVETFYAGQASTPATADLPASALRSSAPRANVVRFRKFQLLAGETAKAGPIRVPADGATKVWGRWTATGPGAFEIASGIIAPQPLAVK